MCWPSSPPAWSFLPWTRPLGSQCSSPRSGSRSSERCTSCTAAASSIKKRCANFHRRPDPRNTPDARRAVARGYLTRGDARWVLPRAGSAVSAPSIPIDHHLREKFTDMQPDSRKSSLYCHYFTPSIYQICRTLTHQCYTAMKSRRGRPNHRRSTLIARPWFWRPYLGGD